MQIEVSSLRDEPVPGSFEVTTENPKPATSNAVIKGSRHRQMRFPGFTLIETLIATALLVTASLSIATLFAYSVRTNILNQQRTTATLLATSKMEELRATPAIMDLSISGGGLDGADPATDYWEYVSVSTGGALTVDRTTATAPYLRLWQIDGTNPRLVTVAVFAQRSGISGDLTELVRTTTTLTNGY